jgi:hypothetical protein
MTKFYVAPDRVKAQLGWPLPWYYEGYQARDGPNKTMSFAKDWGEVKDTADLAANHKWDPELK